MKRFQAAQKGQQGFRVAAQVVGQASQFRQQSVQPFLLG